MIYKEYNTKSKILKTIKAKYFARAAKSLVEVHFTNKNNPFERPESRQLSVFLPPILIDLLSKAQIQVLGTYVFFARRKEKSPTCREVIGHTNLSRTHVKSCCSKLRELGLLEAVTIEESYNQFSGWFRKTFFGLTRKRLANAISFQKLKELKKRTILSAKAQKILFSQKVTPPYITPLNKKRGSFLPQESVQENFLKEVFKKIESLGIFLTDFDKKAKKKFLAKRISEIGLNRVLTTITAFAESSFLKKANGFGWQEAIVQSYQDKGGVIWPASKHLDRYGKTKPGLVWILKNTTKILQGKYDDKPLSDSASKKWAYDSKATDNSAEVKVITRSEVEQDIESQTKSDQERNFRRELLDHFGERVYHSWLAHLEFEKTEKKILLKAKSRFVLDKIQELFQTELTKICKTAFFVPQGPP